MSGVIGLQSNAIWLLGHLHLSTLSSNQSRTSGKIGVIEHGNWKEGCCHGAVYFVKSVNFHSHPQGCVLLSLFYVRGRWTMEKSPDLPRVTQQLSGKYTV